MDEELLKLAQAEYLRQYDIWLRSQPSKQVILNEIEKIIKHYTKLTQTTKGNAT